MKHSFLDRYSRLESPIHRLDPRTKLIVFFSAVVIIVSEPKGELLSYLIYYPLILGLIGLSRVPPAFFIKRCLIAFPFILTAAVFLPLSHLLGGDTGGSFPLTAKVSQAASLLLRAVAAVALLTLLTSSERFHRLLKGLRSLGMPPLMGILSALMYRYIFILSDELMKIRLARESRTPGRLRISRIKVFGNQAAVLFLRSWERAQTVYNAMLARGFSGEFPQAREFRFQVRDGLFVGVVISAFLSVRILL